MEADTSQKTSYQITIALSEATVAALASGGFSLCALKSTATTAGGGQPLFWIVDKQFAPSMAVEWTSACAGGTIQYPGQIIVVSTIPMEYGQVVSLPDGTLSDGGLPDALSMLNTTATQYISALCSESHGGYLPTASFPLYGNMMNAFAPVELVLLMFTTYPAQQTEPIQRAYAQGLLVDMGSETSRAVSFDINSGWSWGDAAWGRTIAPNTLLAPILIQLTAL